MIRSILVPLADGPGRKTAWEYASWLAAKNGSRLHGLAIVDIKFFEIPILGTPDGFMPSVVAAPVQETQNLMEEFRSRAKERTEEFGKACASAGLPCSTDIKTGIPGELIAREAIAHDIVVMAGGGSARTASPQRMDDLVSAAIHGSIRPVLVAGREFREIRQILVAYDGSVHSSRALLVAAELASRPGIQCSIVNIASSEESGNETLVPAQAFLSNHGVNPKKHVILGSKVSDLIGELATATHADLLVMGAYGHSPIREMLVGSTTEKVLLHCDCSAVLQT